MNKLCNIFKNILLGLLLLMSVSMFAQPDRYNRAYLLFREKNTDLAKLAIDSSIAHPETQFEPATWTTRAFIYFDIYRRTDRFRLYSELRDTIISSVKTSMRLMAAKPDEDNKGNNTKLLVNLSAGYFNLAKALLQDSINDEKSLIAYNKFKELYLLTDSTANFEIKDVEYFLAVGSVFSEIFIKDNSKVKEQNVAKVALLKVLELQPDNPAANINLGLMYYNQAVNLSKELDYGADLSQIDFVQENMVKLAKQSEQFIIRVYNNDNKNVKAIEALYYIYRMLNETARSDDFKKIGEPYGIKFNTEEKTEDGKDETPKDEKKAGEKKEEKTITESPK